MTAAPRARLRDLAAAVHIVWHAAPAAAIARAVLTVLAGATPVAGAWLLKLILDGFTTGADRAALRTLALALAGAGVLAGVVPVANRYLASQLERAVALRTSDRLFAAVARYPGLARFEDPVFADRLRMAQMGGQTGPGRVFDSGLGIAQALVTLTGFLGTLLVLSPLMAAVVAVASVPGLAAELALSRRRAATMYQVSPHERREQFYAQLLSGLPAAKEVRLFGLAAFFHRRMLVELGASNAAHRRLDLREGTARGMLAGLSALVAGFGLWWAVGAAADGRLTVGDVSVLVAAVAGVAATLSALTHDIASAYQSMLFFAQFRAIENDPVDLPVAARPAACRPLRHGIELDNVWFRYSPEHAWALRGVDLRIPHGRTVAVVGRNGAGKSTLVKLLCRYYDPCEGSIRWDGTDLRDLDPVDLRRRLGAVFQDFMAYEMTAAENIEVGDLERLGTEPEPERAGRLAAAAGRAGIHDVLAALPDGYHTLLTRVYVDHTDRADPSTGVVLSGGQWQRLALARAFVREGRDLLILDEPTSGLDAEAEHELHARLAEFRRGRTSLLVSHRLGAVRGADRIVVLHNGRIVEEGTHDALMAVGGRYAGMYRLQARPYEPVPG